MRLKNDASSYGAVARLLHWSIALLIFIAIPLGLISASIGPKSADPDLAHVRDILLFCHKSLGLLILALAAMRLLWLCISPRPALPLLMPRTERWAAKGAHALLYLLMIGMPLTGILLSQSAGFPVSLFGLAELPRIFPLEAAVPLMERSGVKLGFLLHSWILAYALFAVLALHIAGLMKHHFIDRDPSIWRRMAPWRVAQDSESRHEP